MLPSENLPQHERVSSNLLLSISCLFVQFLFYSFFVFLLLHNRLNVFHFIQSVCFRDKLVRYHSQRSL